MPPVPPVNASLDSDGDGIANGVDSCTELAEDFDGVDDDDGCPEMKLMVLVDRSIEIGPPGDELLRSSRHEIAFVKPLVFEGRTLTHENDEALALLARPFMSGELEAHVACANDDEAKVVVAWLAAHGVAREVVHAVVHADASPLSLSDTNPGGRSGQCVVRYSNCALVENEQRSR